MSAAVEIPAPYDEIEIPDEVRPILDLPVVYVAGPYLSDPPNNVRQAVLVADALTQTGVMVAYAPHVNLLAHLIQPRPEEHWHLLDYAMLAKCDALIRIPGASAGADREVRLAYEMEIPVFFDDSTLRAWAEHF